MRQPIRIRCRLKEKCQIERRQICWWSTLCFTCQLVFCTQITLFLAATPLPVTKSSQNTQKCATEKNGKINTWTNVKNFTLVTASCLWHQILIRQRYESCWQKKHPTLQRIKKVKDRRVICNLLLLKQKYLSWFSPFAKGGIAVKLKVKILALRK